MWRKRMQPVVDEGATCMNSVATLTKSLAGLLLAAGGACAFP